MDKSISTVAHVDEFLLEKLAKVALQVGVNIQEGQHLIVMAPVSALPLARLITKHAYMLGAGLVSVFYKDSEATLMLYKYGADYAFDRVADWFCEGLAKAYSDNTALLSISGDNPLLLVNEDSDKVSRVNQAYLKAYKPALERISNFDINWSIVPFPSCAWAEIVYPDDPVPIAIAKLANTIFSVSRAHCIDPIAAWAEHNNFLHQKSQWLSQRDFAEIRFSGPNTSLKVGLAEGHRWSGGSSIAQNGIMCNPNIPTEEVFTAPHARRVEGYATSTKPLVYQGMLIENIRVRFDQGRVVEASASKGEEMLNKILDIDEGARRLGEVALVPHSSLLSKMNTLFYDTLFDENAASHIAFGQCYSKCFKKPDNALDNWLEERGGNSSITHIDWMIGSGDMNVDGLTKNGVLVPIMRGGEWAF
ncbi:aminopeptidase [Candidatus Liberibacter asiaticus]|uniref:Aminopeptidase protein n=3 Tax=Liberibacter asiaticus TaxID=34021 RepID=C6XFW2_LIBAP|nr:aminopeptidase [Candidatus Liberibacter asiaticus]ACT57265.2 aminopeptidase protein [Candidatus Liberibacter asiaticus str. psy62]ALK07139.1 aminopeptidase [Candidatus Liberibacter asiaticus]ASK52615.1 aminopeptidase [Candidatus Liberibacter asiaticus]AWL13940.1 aminopeptidase [Candidatus Liberibacter asiaticus]KAE9510256.1 Aminopeptidase T [Candidatus Liberibacter asiaticus]